MYKINYTPVNSKSDTAWNNIINASKIRALDLISDSIVGWFKCNPKKKTTDLDKELKLNDVNLYLIASKISDKDQNEYVLPYDINIKTKYRITYLFNRKNNNLELLNKCGLAINTKIDIENYDRNLVRLNSVKINIDYLQYNLVEDILNKQLNESRNKYNKKITTVINNITDDGSPIFTFTIDGNIITKIGYIIDNKQKIKYVDITKYNT